MAAVAAVVINGGTLGSDRGSAVTAVTAVTTEEPAAGKELPTGPAASSLVAAASEMPPAVISPEVGGGSDGCGEILV